MDVGIPRPWLVCGGTVAQTRVEWEINIYLVCLLKRQTFADVFLAHLGH